MHIYYIYNLLRSETTKCMCYLVSRRALQHPLISTQTHLPTPISFSKVNSPTGKAVRACAPSCIRLRLTFCRSISKAHSTRVSSTSPISTPLSFASSGWTRVLSMQVAPRALCPWMGWISSNVCERTAQTLYAQRYSTPQWWL